MKVLVIPDVHLKNWIFDKAENVLKSGKAERAVCLMDMPDDWDMEFQIDRYRQSTTGLLHLPRSIRIPFGAMEIMT